jgi:hypothetical protein
MNVVMIVFVIIIVIFVAIIIIIMSKGDLGSDRHGAHAEAETTGTDTGVDE